MAKTVLIVEDNELNMKLFHDLLDAHGYDTLQTKDGVEALAIARQKRPDLILMDIQLPELSGLEVTKWIKEDDELKSIPVVAVTAFAMRVIKKKSGPAAARPISPSRYRCSCSWTQSNSFSNKANRLGDDSSYLGR